MATYAIGDVQGCKQKLDVLLDLIYARSPDANLIFLGDLVNRGPHSLATLRRVREAGARVVLGNHDLHLLAVAHGFQRLHRNDTIGDVLDAPDREELLDWLRRQPLALLEGKYLLVHAGVLPQWTAQKTMALAAEVELVLRGADWLEFLRQMYGNEPASWSDELRGMDRLRCIVNALTRIRFCTTDGKMDLTSSKGVEIDVPGYLRWFEVPGRKTQDTTVVFGHWSTLGLVVRSDIIALDTGCLWGGKLSAVCLEDRSVLQVDCPQYQVPGTI